MRGQYSLEALLIIVLIVTASALFVPKIAEQTEMNQIMSAARIGADEAVSLISLGGKPENDNFDPPYPATIRVIGIDFTETSPDSYVSRLTVTTPSYYDNLNDTERGWAVSMINSRMTDHVVDSIRMNKPGPSTKTVDGITFDYYRVDASFNTYIISTIELEGKKTFNAP